MERHKQVLKTFLGKYFRHRELGDDDDIFASGAVTSLFAMQLVLFLESKFSLTIENEDLEIDNFRTVTALCRLIERKLSSSDEIVLEQGASQVSA